MVGGAKNYLAGLAQTAASRQYSACMVPIPLQTPQHRTAAVSFSVSSAMYHAAPVVRMVRDRITLCIYSVCLSVCLRVVFVGEVSGGGGRDRVAVAHQHNIGHLVPHLEVQ